ncbi:hypothetical protein OG896_10480 [Streptomyces sp. NBC_00669]|uniref:hypothetical protein n=1 Tax=Streptomyces sp. NBC_00669 TaxID=2976011 RepID=UPI002E37AEC5|nr:hypothetical protein [Streptomyces sp. NBC_00669]
MRPATTSAGQRRDPDGPGSGSGSDQRGRPDPDRPYPGQLNSVQLNVVTFVDVAKATAARSLDGAVFMMDNSVGGAGQGTADLRTVCKQGQVLNWIVRPIAMSPRPDGSWPPLPRIGGVVFLDGEEGDEDVVAEVKVCTDLKRYGVPDRMRDPYTPVYCYWAGAVVATLAPGRYPYRLTVELEQDGRKERLYLDSPGRPSIEVVPVG